MAREPWHDTAESMLLPLLALAGALGLFGAWVWFGGHDPAQAWTLLFVGAFGDAFSFQNTLQRAAPLMLTALCVALPARAGLTVIGGGFAGVLAEAEPGAGRTLKDLLALQPRAPRHFKAPVAPNPWHVDTIASRLGRRSLREVLSVFVDQLRLDDAHFEVAELEQMLLLAEQLDACAAALPLQQRFRYAQAPVDTRTDTQLQAFLEWAAAHAASGQAGRPWFLDEVDAHSRLDRMEMALRACTLWLWLDLRFEGVYGHVEEVLALRGALNDGIERQLGGKRPLAQLRRGMRRGR